MDERFTRLSTRDAQPSHDGRHGTGRQLGIGQFGIGRGEAGA